MSLSLRRLESSRSSFLKRVARTSDRRAGVLHKRGDEAPCLTPMFVPTTRPHARHQDSKLIGANRGLPPPSTQFSRLALPASSHVARINITPAKEISCISWPQRSSSASSPACEPSPLPPPSVGVHDVAASHLPEPTSPSWAPSSRLS